MSKEEQQDMTDAHSSSLLMRLARWQLRRRDTHPRSTRRILVTTVGAVTASMLVAGGAYAFFKSNGSGSGTAVTAVAQAVSATRGSSNSLSLYPGSVGDIALVVTNPNPYPVTVTEVDAGSTSSIVAFVHGTSTQISTCSVNSGISFKWTAKTGLAINIAANGGVANILITGTGSPNSGAIAMSNSSDPSCGTSTGVDFSIPITVDAQSTTGSFSTPVSTTVTVP